jgi:predicted RNase H-related nuclease YkuK (DUF458 family)
MKIPQKIDLDEVVAFVKKHDSSTRLYIGCDSEKHKINGQWYADYVTCIVVHINGNRGCKIFGALNREKDLDYDKKKPRLRLMTEVRHAADLYLKTFDRFAAEFGLEEIAMNINIHLDINGLPEHGSSIVMSEAIGYIKATCGIEPMIKDRAWAASYACDRLTEIVNIPHSQHF